MTASENACSHFFTRGGGRAMEMKYKAENRQLTITLTGELDHHAAKGLMEAIDRCMEQNLPVKTLLDLDEENQMVYSHVIRRDGSFVIRTGDAFRKSYFERVLSQYAPVDGKTPELYIEALSDAMAKGESYSDEVRVNGERTDPRSYLP